MTRAGDDFKGPGRPAQLSRERIVETVASFANVDSMTMRELAARLEVRHSALYRWVKNRDELFDLISEVVVDRILGAPAPDTSDWHVQLDHLAWTIREQFLAVPGYASYLARPHPHNAHSVDRLRKACTSLFADAGSTPDLAEQSWLIFITATVGWLAAEEQPPLGGPAARRFELFVDVLLRGLPARERYGEDRREKARS